MYMAHKLAAVRLMSNKQHPMVALVRGILRKSVDLIRCSVIEFDAEAVKSGFIVFYDLPYHL